MAERIGSSQHLSRSEVRDLLEPQHSGNTTPEQARKILGGNNEGMLRDPKSNNLGRVRAQILSEKLKQSNKPKSLIDTVKDIFGGIH